MGMSVPAASVPSNAANPSIQLIALLILKASESVKALVLEACPVPLGCRLDQLIVLVQ